MGMLQQATIADQRETQKLLTQALNVLQAVYAKGKQEQPGPPPPPGFGEYKKAGGAGGVMGMLQQIISEAKETALNEQQQNKNAEADLHKSCDFVLKNFDIRQAARDQEVEALRQAKAILSGAKFTEFLQRRD